MSPRLLPGATNERTNTAVSLYSGEAYRGGLLLSSLPTGQPVIFMIDDLFKSEGRLSTDSKNEISYTNWT